MSADLDEARPLPRTRHPRGWAGLARGRAAHVSVAAEHLATTVQACGLYPYVAAVGAPAVGWPMGRQPFTGEIVQVDPIAWVRHGLTTNPGMMVFGEPGVGKSSFVKRLGVLMAAGGARLFFAGDLKPDYADLVGELGGQRIPLGRGVGSINPLDAGPLGQAARRLGGDRGRELMSEVRGRRVAALAALCSVVADAPLSAGAQGLLGAAVDVLVERCGDREPTVPDVLDVLRDGPEPLMAAAWTSDTGEYERQVRPLAQTVQALCQGPLAGIFDRPTSTPVDIDAPAVSIDISSVGSGDQLVAAAMLSVWAYAGAVVDGRAALAAEGHERRTQTVMVLDELWRALRGAPGLVEHADALTRLNRSKGVASIMLSHSLGDLEALPTEEDRAKARGFVDRAGTLVLGGLRPRELAQVARVSPLTSSERELVQSWSAPPGLRRQGAHPGRGHYLLKVGDRVGVPCRVDLTAREAALFDTDAAMRE